MSMSPQVVLALQLKYSHLPSGNWASSLSHRFGGTFEAFKGLGYRIFSCVSEIL